MLRPLLAALLFLANAAVADSNYLTIDGADGVPLAVATTGNPENPALLFIHGLGQSHYVFHEQFTSELADDYYLVAFDLRGHGASGKPWATDAYTQSATWAEDVSAVVAATGIERPVVIGWSFGSLVALDYLRQQGADALSGLVLTGAIGGLKPFRMPTEEDPLTAEFTRVRELQMSPNPRDLVAAVERMVEWLTSAPLPEDEREVLRSTAMMLPAYARRAIYSRRQSNTDLVPILENVPVFLALGGDDNALMVEDGASLASTHDSFSLSIYEGAGHSVFLEQPARFNTELREFAAGSFARDAESAVAAAGEGP